MATATATAPEPTTQAATFRPWPMTVAFYERMIEAGVFQDERIFLWKGRLVENRAKLRPHTVAVMRLYDALKPLVTASGIGFAETEAPVSLIVGGASMPEPDVKVVRGRVQDYKKIPTSKDVPLIAEVADSSLAADRSEKLEQYAIESIPVYWIANVVDRRIEVYTGPTGPAEAPGYAACTIYRSGERAPVVLDGVEVGRIDIDEIFPKTDPWL